MTGRSLRESGRAHSPQVGGARLTWRHSSPSLASTSHLSIVEPRRRRNPRVQGLSRRTSGRGLDREPGSAPRTAARRHAEARRPAAFPPGYQGRRSHRSSASARLPPGTAPRSRHTRSRTSGLRVDTPIPERCRAPGAAIARSPYPGPCRRSRSTRQTASGARSASRRDPESPIQGGVRPRDRIQCEIPGLVLPQ